MRASLIAAAVCLSIAGLATAADVEAAKRQTSIPAQSLGPALQALAKERDFQVIYISEEIERIRTRGASGELTSAEALAQLLDGTGLTYRYLDDRTVTILPAAQGAAGDPATSGSAMATPASALPVDHSAPAPIQLVRVETPTATAAAKAGTTDRMDKREKATDEEADEATEVRVTGSRIRRDPAETDVSPVTVFTRQDIERSGAVMMSDFLGRITQASNQVGAIETSDYPLSGRTTVNLRGLGNNTTLVLLNGRRMPKSGQGFGADDYNLAGVPLSSVERIEILTNSASAIYGSDAIGGVVNIITRKDYSGLDVAVQYGNTFDTDVSEKSVDLHLGHAGTIFGRGIAVNLNLATNERNRLATKDRPYTARSDYSDSGGRPAGEVQPYNDFGGAGGITTKFWFLPDPLPGLDTNMVAIPAGQDGRNLTIEDFLNAGPPSDLRGEYADYGLLMAPNSERSAGLSTVFNLTDRMEFFLEGSHYEFHNAYEGMPPRAQIPVPADNPFNPFGAEVVVNKVFYELGPTRSLIENRNTLLATGLRGNFFSDWRYELYGDYSRYVYEQIYSMPSGINFYPGYSFDPETGLTIVHTPATMALSDTNPDTAFNAFGDGRTTMPNDIDFLRSLIGADEYRETAETWTGAFQADGDLMALPGGMLKLAIGGEHRREKVDFYKVNTIGRSWISLDEGAERDVSAAFAELSIPLAGERQQLPGMRSLLLSLAGRIDSESIFGEEFTPRVSLMWRPVDSLALRTAYSLGYKVPNLLQLFGPDNTYDIFNPFDPPVDPVTGELVDQYLQREGGNPDLDPEESTSWSAGFVYEPLWLRGLSVSADYFDIDYTNKVTTYLPLTTFLELFPERVERDPLTNHITMIDMRAVNLATARARGFDVRLVHSVNTASFGTFNSHLNYTYNLENSQQTTPDSPVVENVDASYFPRVRANADVFWNYGALELGPTITYESSTRNFLFGGAVAPVRIRHAIVVDLQGSYDFGLAAGNASAWTEGLKLTVGINNLLDRLPSPTDGIGGYAKVDPRQRRFYISLRKSFQ